jgi:uracil-DNA glycosylase family 4
MEKPALSPVQRAWLREIGIDAKMLAHFCASSFPPDDAEAHVPGPAQCEITPDRIAGTPNRAHADEPESTAASSRASAVNVEVSTGDTHSGEFRRLADLAVQPVTDAPAGHGSATLAGLRQQTEDCRACGLHRVRGRTVFGEGVESAPGWMFIGEAPGEYDDSAGRPFQGRAGELLHAMLASVGLTGDSPVYFTNVLKCRPIGNRSPMAKEVAACLPLLRRQITLLRPACLVALGRVAATALLGREDDLDSLRGSVHAFVDDEGRSIPLVVTHHPASLLLHGRLKADAWRDLNLIRHMAGTEPSPGL